MTHIPTDKTDEEEQFRDVIKNSPLARVLSELRRVETEPRLLVIVTHAFIELMINHMVLSVCKHGRSIYNDRRGYTHSAKLTMLNEMAVLSDHHYHLLNWFRKLRNDCAHEWDFKIHPEQLGIFTNAEQRDPTNFADLCMIILIDLWKTHEDIIGPQVLSGAYEIVTTKVVMTEKPAPKYRIPLKSDPSTIHER